MFPRPLPGPPHTLRRPRELTPPTVGTTSTNLRPQSRLDSQPSHQAALSFYGRFYCQLS
jgi:hypothetical protein